MIYQETNEKKGIIASQILNSLDKNLLNEFIEVSNGVKMMLKQYILYYVIPKIPSDGFFILKNGEKIEAIQLIKENILKGKMLIDELISDVEIGINPIKKGLKFSKITLSEFNEEMTYLGETIKDKTNKEIESVESKEMEEI